MLESLVDNCKRQLDQAQRQFDQLENMAQNSFDEMDQSVKDNLLIIKSEVSLLHHADYLIHIQYHSLSRSFRLTNI